MAHLGTALKANWHKSIIGYTKALIGNWKNTQVGSEIISLTATSKYIIGHCVFILKESGSTWLHSALWPYGRHMFCVNTTSTNFEYLAFACSHREFLPTNTAISQCHLGSYDPFNLFDSFVNGHCRVMISKMNWTRLHSPHFKGTFLTSLHEIFTQSCREKN